MNKIITCGIFFCIIQKAFTEESFCENKCYGQGVDLSRSCHCDSACSTVYNDCCSDSKYFDRTKNFTSVRNLTCKRKALVVNSCLKEWKGPDFIINSCKMNYHYEMDPIGNSPVTSESTGVTYNNYYCAICNGDAEHLIMWNVKVSCPLPSPNLSVDKDEAFKSIFYSYTTNEWGYVTPNNITKKSSFQGCAVTSEIPDDHLFKIRRCETSEVKTCANNWKKDAIREMCSSYTDPVYSNGTKYKNFYCAICNRVDISTLSCGDAISARKNNQPESDDLNKMSFSLLLDINFSEGNSVGKTLAATNCRQGEIFDPFARRCRNIVCGIPGYVMHNGLCTAELEPPLKF